MPHDISLSASTTLFFFSFFSPHVWSLYSYACKRVREAGRKLYKLSLRMNKVILTPHYTRYSVAAPLTQCLLSEVLYTLVCQDHLSKESPPSPSGAGSDCALGNGNWQRPAWQTQSLTQSWIWAPVLITAPFTTLFLLFLVCHCGVALCV